MWSAGGAYCDAARGVWERFRGRGDEVKGWAFREAGEVIPKALNLTGNLGGVDCSAWAMSSSVCWIESTWASSNRSRGVFEVS